MTLNEAFIASQKFHRPCVIRWTLYKGWLVEELTDESFIGTVDFLISENGAIPVPLTQTAKNALAHMVWKAIGGDSYLDNFTGWKPGQKFHSTYEPSKETLDQFIERHKGQLNLFNEDRPKRVKLKKIKIKSKK